MRTIVLQTSDDKIFRVDYEVMKCSLTIKQMIEDLGLDEDSEEVIPMMRINSVVLEKILVWADFHKDDQPPKEDDGREKKSNDICEFDVEFLKLDQATLFEMLIAANFLNIQALLETICKTIANMMIGRTPEEIRQMFNIKNDLSSEDEDELNDGIKNM